MKKIRKFIFVSGGVISGLVKVTTASIGRLLQARVISDSHENRHVFKYRCRNYSPAEHGEVLSPRMGLRLTKILVITNAF